MDKSWLIHESPDLNPDWLDEIRSFFLKNLNISLNISFSKILPQREVEKLYCSFWGFLYHVFHKRNNIVFFPIRLGIYRSPINDNTNILIWSWPWTLFGSKFWIVNNVLRTFRHREKSIRASPISWVLFISFP